jgi:hypothetical protein
MWKTWKIYKILQTWHFLSEGIVMLGVMQESYDVGEDLMFFFWKCMSVDGNHGRFVSTISLRFFHGPLDAPLRPTAPGGANAGSLWRHGNHRHGGSPALGKSESCVIGCERQSLQAGR